MDRATILFKQAGIGSSLLRYGGYGLKALMGGLGAYSLYDAGKNITGGVRDVAGGDVSGGMKRMAGGAGSAALSTMMLGGTGPITEALKRSGATARLAKIPGIRGHAARGAAWGGDMLGDMWLWTKADRMMRGKQPAAAQQGLAPANTRLSALTDQLAQHRATYQSGGMYNPYKPDYSYASM